MFSPPRHELIEQATEFRCYLGGAEANVAIGLERLGVHSGWIGKLTRNALGRRTVNEIRSHGVDTTGVVWTDEARVGTFFFEFAEPPRPQRTIYDRAHSAAATMTADEFDWEYIGRAEWLHMTGITPGLSATCGEATQQILARAKQRGIQVCFDVNYRELVWSREEAAAALRDLLPFVDLLVATESDMAMLAGGSSVAESLRHVCGEHPVKVAVTTFANGGCQAFDGEHMHTAPSHPTTVVNRLGAGDAFVAGLLYGYVTRDLPTGLAYGSAMAALKMTIPQNTPLIDQQDVERLLNGQKQALVR